MVFAIGFNPNETEERTWSYVVLRQIPSDLQRFGFYGENLLHSFDARPTWVYATPHNIQRSTPQNALGNSCDGNADVFLMEQRVAPEELEASRLVIVTEVPPVPY